MIDIIKQYAEIINIGLFGTILGLLATIVGLLHRYSTISRQAIKDKSDAEIASIRAINDIVTAREENSNRNHLEVVNLLEKELAMYKALSEMPDEKRLFATKINNENVVIQPLASHKIESILDKSDIEGVIHDLEPIDNTFRNHFLKKLNTKKESNNER